MKQLKHQEAFKGILLVIFLSFYTQNTYSRISRSTKKINKGKNGQTQYLRRTFSLCDQISYKLRAWAMLLAPSERRLILWHVFEVTKHYFNLKKTAGLFLFDLMNRHATHHIFQYRIQDSVPDSHNPALVCLPSSCLQGWPCAPCAHRVSCLGKKGPPDSVRTNRGGSGYPELKQKARF